MLIRPGIISDAFCIGKGCVDLVRGGVFDALERNPSNGMPTEFAWETTKDFWQQEQAILAYYIMSGINKGNDDDDTNSNRFLELARYCTAFWNLYFVDQDNRKITSVRYNSC